MKKGTPHIDIILGSGTTFRVWFIEESIRNAVTNAYLSGVQDGKYQVKTEEKKDDNTV